MSRPQHRSWDGSKVRRIRSAQICVRCGTARRYVRRRRCHNCRSRAWGSAGPADYGCFYRVEPGFLDDDIQRVGCIERLARHLSRCAVYGYQPSPDVQVRYVRPGPTGDPFAVWCTFGAKYRSERWKPVHDRKRLIREVEPVLAAALERRTQELRVSLMARGES